MSDYTLDVRIWDVEHGSAIFLHVGQRDVVIDAGANDEFSPAWWLRNQFGRTKVDYMIISHPHHDHIKDLDEFEAQNLRPGIISRPKAAREIIERKVDEEDDEDYIEDAEIYLELDEFSGTPDPAPSDPAWAGVGDSRSRHRADGGHRSGVTFHNYSAPESHWESGDYKCLNNMSRLTVVNCRGFKLVTMGDMLKKGIEGVMEKKDVAMAACADADVLVAPHHGRESSYVHEFVAHVNPDLVAFSEEPEGDDPDTVAGKYGDVANGAPVRDETTDEEAERFVVTTRSDGRIRLQVNRRDDWIASCYPNKTTELAKSRNYQPNRY